MSILNKTTANSADAAAFENAEDTLGTEAAAAAEVQPEASKPESNKAESKASKKPAAEQAAAEPAAEPAAATPESDVQADQPTSIVQAKPLTHLMAAGSNISPLKDLEKVFEKQGIEVDFNTFPRYRDDKGTIGDTAGNEAGSWVELMVVSWSDSWMVAPGDDSEKAKEFVRYSRDGLTIRSEDDWNGKTCDEYVTYLRDEMGYEKAGVRKYTNIYGMLVAAEQDDCPGLQQVIQLALAPTSGAAWQSYMVNRTLRARMGLVKETTGNPVVRFTSHRVKGSKNTFFKLDVTEGVTEVNLAA